ncbi:MAG: preprotein translocase subunit YajC [bacterium]|nr:preprotein translocase subunit YajC [bacterium]
MFPLLASLNSQLIPFLAFLEEVPAAPKAWDSPWLMIVLIGGLFWFLMIAPEKKIRKERSAMLAGLKKNDPVVTTGGMYGIITKVDEESVTLRIDKDVHVRMQRGAVAGLPNQESEAKKSDEKSTEKAE